MCELQDVNPPKFDGKEDMAQLAYLNEASVIHNLRLRYENKSQIYTYSGLFLVAVNPYRELPIYTDKVVKLYMSHGGGNYSSNLHQLGQSEEMKKKPHVFAVADKAYHAMLKQRTDQSVLITGESGAGKTENTKKVIQFLIAVASDVRYRSTTSSTSNGSNSSININSNSNNNNNSYHTLESQILSANPILEAFGNAQTLRNNNSSRFGKFIRIIFNTSGQIAGSYINWYLLEKSRVTHPNKHERNYHVFYQLLKGASDDIKDALLLKDTELSDYQFTRGTPSSIDGVSDESEYAMLTHSMNIMNFTAKKQLDFLRVVAAILHLGNVTFSGNKPTEQANIADISSIHRICHVLGIANAQDFMKALLAPRILAGRQWVTRAQTTEQAKYALEALARSLYERMFGRLVDSINESINKHQNHYINGNAISSNMSNSYIGVLDIAGFEIFTVNTFEQLCINYTNEKLQQFFNHHMFMLEQQEYKREDIEWTDIDFGLDLQPTIDLIESSHPLVGILASLDDQSLMQRSTDANFTEDLHRNWRDHPSQVYRPRRFKMGFVVKHYASEVKYDTHGWLNKNRDPLNESVTRVLASSRESFIAGLFSEYSDDNLDSGPASSTNADLFAFQSQPSNASGNNRLSLGGRGPKAGSFRTVAQRHKEQLTALMARLHTTEPHFVRCIVPNEYKRPGIIDTLLVLNQLRCNGVLEGIRIYRQGFPNRLTFDEFTRQYSILAGPSKSKNKKRSAYEYIEPRQAAEQLLRELAIDTGRYRIGRTKHICHNCSAQCSFVSSAQEMVMVGSICQCQAIVVN
ncbi:hypothetical protein GQ42DRAFT_167166 [Ramicandelaber brevisporus]|nr:hypothetical protein GQ42DRAFT_167166 [Ramicandelaber brevisporus]